MKNLCSLDERLALARNSDTPEWILKELTTDVELIQLALVKNSELPLSILKILAKDLKYKTLIVENQDLPWAKIKPFIDSEALARIVSRRNFSRVALTNLSKDKSYLLRLIAAYNETTPGDVLHGLVHDQENIVLAVANNVAVSPTTLRVLSLHSNDEIRLVVASNIKTPKENLLFIKKHDKNEKIRIIASNTLQELKDNEARPIWYPNFKT